MNDVKALGMIIVILVIGLALITYTAAIEISGQYDSGHNTCQGYVTESCDDLGVFKFDKDLFKCKRLKRPEFR